MDAEMERWIRTGASITELREVRALCDGILRERPYSCGECGQDIPQSFTDKHPAHAQFCSRFLSIVTY